MKVVHSKLSEKVVLWANTATINDTSFERGAQEKIRGVMNW